MSDSNEVRRPLTTVFVDLVGSTPLSIELDEEDYARLIADYRTITAGLAEKHRGFIPRDEGDGRFFWFGWPTARRDDADRAIAMAVELVAAIGPLSERTQRLSGRRVDVRVGVHTGSAIVATEGDNDFADVSGAAINLAAKVQAQAEPGAVLVSEATEAALGGRWLLEPSGSMTIDSLEGAIKLARVVGPNLDRSVDGPFVGRRDELARLDPKPGSATLLVGSAGLGKSRLVEALLEASDDEVVLVQAAERRMTAPFAPLLEALRTREDHPIDPPDPDDLAGGIVDRAVRLLDAQPFTLIVEDLHWLDASSVEVLDRLVALQDPRLKIVMTSRSVPNLRELAAVELIELGPLPDDCAEELLGAVAPGLSAETASELADRAAGNPFFLTWLGRTAGERFDGVRRILRPRSGVPIVVQQAVRSQLDGSGVDDEVTTMAAVLGLDFDAGMLTVALDRDADEVDAALSRLGDHGIVDDIGLGRFRFSHSLVHELAYDLMLGDERRKRHARAADLFETAAPNDHALIGFHHDEAGNVVPAIEHKLAAAAVCRRSNAWVEASTLTGRVIELVEAGEDLPGDLVLEARELHAVVSTTLDHGYLETTSEATGMLELLGDGGDQLKIAMAKTRDWAAAMARSDLPTIQALNYELYRVATTSLPSIRPYNTNARALCSVMRGHHRHAERLFDRSVDAMLRSGLDPVLEQGWATVDDPIVLSVAYSAPTLSLRGRLTTARDRLTKAMHRAETLAGGGPTITHLANLIAGFHASLGDAEATRGAAEHMIEVAADLGLAMWERFGQVNLVVSQVLASPSAEACEMVIAAADVAASLAPQGAPPLYLVAAQAAVRFEDKSLGLRCLDAIDALAAAHRTRALQPESQRLRAHWSSDPAAGLLSAIEKARRCGARRYELRALIDLHRLDSGAVVGDEDVAGAISGCIASFPEPDADPDIERARERLGV